MGFQFMEKEWCMIAGAKIITIIEMVLWAMLAGLAGSLQTIKGMDFTNGIEPNMVRDILTEFGGPFVAVLISSARTLMTKAPADVVAEAEKK